MDKRKRYDQMYNLWSLTIVFCLCVTIFALIFVSCRKGDGEEAAAAPTPSLPAATATASSAPETGTPAASPSPEPAEPSPTATPEESDSGTAVILGETEDMGQEYVDRFIFLGDSTTYGLGVYGVIDKSRIWTPESGTLTLSQWSFTAIAYPDTGEELLIPDAVKTKTPEYMLITLGINGISFMDEDYFKSEYTKLVQSVQQNSPSTRIIINSIYPVAASYKHLTQINNDKIKTANTWLQQVAEESGTAYLDSQSVLVGPDGNLPENLQNGDGMHLTKEGFELVINYLRTHGYQ
jgi:hypothetical protein